MVLLWQWSVAAQQGEVVLIIDYIWFMVGRIMMYLLSLNYLRSQIWSIHLYEIIIFGYKIYDCFWFIGQKFR